MNASDAASVPRALAKVRIIEPRPYWTAWPDRGPSRPGKLEHAGGNCRNGWDSELQRRNAPPVHRCCASALKAKPEVDASADKEAAKASTKPAWRIVLVKDAVIFGSSFGRGSRRVVDDHWCLNGQVRAVMSITQPARM